MAFAGLGCGVLLGGLWGRFGDRIGTLGRDSGTEGTLWARDVKTKRGAPFRRRPCSAWRLDVRLSLGRHIPSLGAD